MASNSKKVHRIRKSKKKPNKANLKADMKRIQKNTEILRELASADSSQT
ncbi:MAG: hypothetical protein JRJ85_18935 [Deltaproteobacteria bacterium]|nr:hypothetical protein [Deltaproteobacteria bacterium]